MKKNSRHDRILELISAYDISTQQQLTDMLRKDGFDVTQATVSRDINILQIYKAQDENGVTKYVSTARDDVHLAIKYQRVLRDGFLSMDNAQNIIVVKTVSGMAMAVAAALDSMKLTEVVGSIAGDDTIMMAIKSLDDVETVMEKIRGVLY
ncbi:MAG: arginine repressor [Lachnospiraceae bacterium]|nr:arginine repressor [Lachnospiraceae bacterium]